MLFNSIEYLFFLPIVFAIYWSIANRLTAQNFFILVVSYFFYGFWDWRFLSLIVISSLTDFLIGRQMEKSTSQPNRKFLLFISLLVNLGFLMTFKYYNFFMDSFVEMSNSLGFNVNTRSLNIILPVGISFYTFQTLSYTIDIYRKKLKASNNIIQFFAYVAFFPQLVAGPIERASNLLPQFEVKRKFEYLKAKDGMRQILWGFFKKVVVADNCAMFVDTIFAHSDSCPPGLLVVGAVLFAFQIYGDFSGYSDIAIGTSKLLGFDLMQNFATPYFSRDIAEFWRRWHISLSTWFRDYLYIPLGGSRVSKLKQIRNVFAIFLVSGFWHGANWTYIFWGLIHALLYIPQVITKSNRKFTDVAAQNSVLPSLSEFFRILMTFIIVTIAWIFFRSDSIGESFTYIFEMFNFTDKNLSFTEVFKRFKLEKIDLWLTFIFVTIMLVIEWVNRRYTHGLATVFKNRIIRTIFYLILSLLVLEYFYGENTFIYFQF